MKKLAKRKKTLRAGKRNLENWYLTHMGDELCINTLAILRWPDGSPTWPSCKGKQRSFLATKEKELWECQRCRRQHSARLGTIFEGSPVTLSKWIGALLLEVISGENGISSHELARQIGVTQKTAWFMLLRLRKAMRLAATSAMTDSMTESLSGAEQNQSRSPKEEESKIVPSPIAVWSADMSLLWRVLQIGGFEASDIVKMEGALRLILRVSFSELQQSLALAIYGQHQPRNGSKTTATS